MPNGTRRSATTQRRGGANLDVRCCPRQGACMRKTVQQNHDEVDESLAPQLLVRVVRRALVIRESIGHARAEQALDR